MTRKNLIGAGLANKILTRKNFAKTAAQNDNTRKTASNLHRLCDHLKTNKKPSLELSLELVPLVTSFDEHKIKDTQDAHISWGSKVKKSCASNSIATNCELGGEVTILVLNLNL